ncbi:hypothetical protein N8198_06730 [Gammaproteobacteria bacterium]|nr:hypothetical protein [Gammaproteobacteria bacterium]
MLLEFCKKALSQILLLFLSLGLIFSGHLLAASSNEPVGLGWKFAYDDDGRISKITDVADRTTSFQYELEEKDRLRMLIRTADDGSDVILRFDENGQRTSMHDSLGTVSYNYDDLGRLIKVQREDSPAVAYAYDTFDRIRLLQVGDFYRIEYNYDYLGRLESMKTPVGVVQYDYVNGQGTVVRKLPNGIETHLDFNPNGELRRIAHNRSSSSGDNSYQLLAEYSYRYRPDGLIESIKEQGIAGQVIRSYEYDKVGRLARAIGPLDREHTYKYDLVGNRVGSKLSGSPQQDYSFDWAGKITRANDDQVEYDAAGNITAVKADSVDQRYRHNQNNQLSEATSNNVAYCYDGNSQLIGRTTVGTETNFTPDPLSEYWQPLVMEDSAGNRILVVWDGTTPLMIIRNGTPKFLLHDHLDSVRLEVDKQGKVLERVDYEPFGSITDSTMANDFAPRFAGLFWDPAADLYLTRYRAYSPRLGQFLQADPLLRVPNVSENNFSRYGYSGSDPVNYVDWDGASRKRVWGPENFWWQAANTLLDRRYAVEFYGEQNKNVLDGARGSGLKAGLAATALDLTRNFVSFGDQSYAKQWYAEERPSVQDTARGNGIVAGLQSTVFDLGARTLGVKTHAGEWYAEQSKNALENASGYGVKAGLIASAADFVGGFAGGKETQGQKLTSIAVSLSEMLVTARLPSAPSVLKDMKTGLNFGQTSLSSLYKTADGNYLGAVRDIFSMSGTMSSLHSKQLTKNAESIYKTAYLNPPKVYKARALENTAKVFDKISTGIDVAKELEELEGVLVVNYSKPGTTGTLSSLAPSRVGGVYLGGAGQALESIGLIDGISVDENNNLILLSKTGDQIDLPPLRIDDVVTVFRSVYPNGEGAVPTGPTVTIDPNPLDPEGSAMIVRHSKATEETYVGWILFQADRLMKGYTLGKDNETTEDVTSTVPGYDEVQNTIYFGQKSRNRKGGNWERFWIVPAEVRQFSEESSDTTLVEVPLKVKTQTMKWVNGELVDDLKRKSSPGARAFTEWFTSRYDEIAEEKYLEPPPESGIDEPVPVFAELRRIALITAIAEKLRNQGVPMPFWMRDYEVGRVPIDKFTPGLHVTRSNGQVTARVHGGVQIMRNNEDAKDFTPVTNLDNLTRNERQATRRKIDTARTLQQAVRDEMRSAKPLEVRQLTGKAGGYRAVPIPGDETKALAPATLVEADLSVLIGGGHSIQLTRIYHSFFNPDGPWGKGWTMDLPRLNKLAHPVNQTSGNVNYRTVHELSTPLNSYRTLFSRIEKVPELENSQLQVPDQTSEFFGLANSKPEFLTGETMELIRKDGGSWHFSDAGDLVAVDSDGFRTVYERDVKGRVSRIVGMLGGQLMASIVLNYDSSGKISSATASNADKEIGETTIDYIYAESGKLSGIQSTAGKLGIRYEGSLVSTVTYRANTSDATESADLVLRSFEYGANGQLSSETDVAGNRTIYSLASDPSGSTITVSSGKDSAESYTRYDPGFNPVEAKYADGSLLTWEYPDSGESVVAINDADGFGIRLTESNDQRQRVMEFDNNYKIKSDFDSAGRLISLSENGEISMEQGWTPFGQLQMAKFENYTDHFEYDQNGMISQVIRAPPGEQDNFSQTRVTRFDSFGRPVDIQGTSGFHLQASYDANGEIATLSDSSAGRKYNVTIDRDRLDRIQQIRTPLESQQYAYDASGRLVSLKVDRKGVDASVEWKSGLLQNVRHFDGGESAFSYYDAPEKKGLLKSITTPNQLVMGYEYGPDNRLRNVNVGGLYKLSLDYDSRGNLTDWRWVPGHDESGGVTPDVKPASSSPVSLDRAIVGKKERRADIRFASKGVKDVMVLEHFFEGGDAGLLLAINGKVKAANTAMAAEFDKLLKVTVNAVGPVEQLQGRWTNFVDKYLADISKPRKWETHDRREVILKPRLIIKSSQTNYKYTNLERIRALTDNFNVYVTHSPNVTTTSLVKKIRSLPRLSTDNMLFVFRLPEMETGMQQRWQAAIAELQQIVGQGNVRYDPSKQELEAATSARDKEVVVLEFTHTKDGIALKGNEVYQSTDVESGGSLTHVKYMLGLSCCNLPQLENGKFIRALQNKGVGIVHGSAREVNADIGLKRLRQLIEMLEHVDHYRMLPMDYVQDVIDQLQNIEHQGMIKVGRRSARYWDFEYPTV